MDTDYSVLLESPSYQVDFSVACNGKRIQGTKRHIRWRFGFANPDALNSGCSGFACRGDEHEVELFWSLTSGKREVYLDGQEIHRSENKPLLIDGRVQFTFQMHGRHIVQIIANAFTPADIMCAGNAERQFDLIIDGLSFFDSARIYELNGMALREARLEEGLTRGNSASFRNNARTFEEQLEYDLSVCTKIAAMNHGNEGRDIPGSSITMQPSALPQNAGQELVPYNGGNPADSAGLHPRATTNQSRPSFVPPSKVENDVKKTDPEHSAVQFGSDKSDFVARDMSSRVLAGEAQSTSATNHQTQPSTESDLNPESREYVPRQMFSANMMYQSNFDLGGPGSDHMHFQDMVRSGRDMPMRDRERRSMADNAPVFPGNEIGRKEMLHELAQSNGCNGTYSNHGYVSAQGGKGDPRNMMAKDYRACWQYPNFSSNLVTSAAF